MSQEFEQRNQSGFGQDLDAALASLDDALAQAGDAVGVIRGQVRQFAALAEVVQEMDEAMARARSSLGGQAARSSGAAPARPLRAVPSQPHVEAEPREAIEPEPLADASPAEAPPTAEERPPEAPAEGPTRTTEQITAAMAERLEQMRQPAAEPERTPESEGEAEGDGDRGLSHCLRLGVSSKTGSLDLKAVDGSVSENPAVVDVALLDYDGRQATLKLWINNAADPRGVRDALMASLRRRLGDEEDADVRIDFEEGSAA